jgi:hypothetical protein
MFNTREAELGVDDFFDTTSYDFKEAVGAVGIFVN